MRSGIFKIATCIIPLLMLPCIGAVAYAEPYGDFGYESVAAYITITKYSGSDSNVRIPVEINGTNVTSIGRFAFMLCYGVTSIAIPNTVTNIGDGAFTECSGLASITIPDSVASIGRNAFKGCSGLTSIPKPK